MTSVLATSYKLSKASWLKYLYPSEFRQFKKFIAEVYDSSMYFVNNVFKHVKESAEKGIALDKNIGREWLAYFKYNKALYTYITT